MAIVLSSTLKGIQFSFEGILQKALTGAEPIWPKVAIKTTSKSVSSIYGWIDDLPGMREWIGDRVINDLQASDYTLKNRKFEESLAIPRTDIEDDVWGIWTPLFQSYAVAAAHHPDVLVFDLLNNAYAAAGNCWDGNPFFGSHSWHGKTFYNYGDGAGNKLTLTPENWSIVRSNFRKQIGDRGTSTTDVRVPFGTFGKLQLTVVVGPDLETDAKKIFTMEKNEFGASNPFFGEADYIVSEVITSSTFWCVMATSLPVKPLIFQERQPARVLTHVNPDSDDVFFKDRYAYGVDYRGAAGYGLWQLAYGGNS